MSEESVLSREAQQNKPHVSHSVVPPKDHFVISDPERLLSTPEVGHIRLELDFSTADMARMRAIYTTIEAARGNATSAAGFVQYCEAILFESWTEMWLKNRSLAVGRFKDEASLALNHIREARDAVDAGDDEGVSRRLDNARNAVETMEGLYAQMSITKQ